MVSPDAVAEVFSNEYGKSIKIHIPASSTFSLSVRDIIGALIKNETLFSQKWKHRMQLMVDELVNNAIEHWSSKNDHVKLLITFYNNHDVEIVVEDNWTGQIKVGAQELSERIRINRQKMLDNPASNKTIRWRWLAMIILNWSDNFSYKNNSNGWLIASLYKKFSPDCAEIEN